MGVHHINLIKGNRCKVSRQPKVIVYPEMESPAVTEEDTRSKALGVFGDSPQTYVACFLSANAATEEQRK